MTLLSGLPVPGVFQECDGAFPAVSTPVDGSEYVSRVEAPTASNTVKTGALTLQEGGKTLVAYTKGGSAYADRSAGPVGITATGTGSPITVSGLSSGFGYTFMVTATNTIAGDIGGTGVASAASNVVYTGGASTVVATPPTLAEMHLTTGWNMRGVSSSTPVKVAETFSDATKVATVWKWIESSAKWAFYSPLLADGGAEYASSKGYEFLSSIATGEGFWVNAK